MFGSYTRCSTDPTRKTSWFCGRSVHDLYASVLSHRIDHTFSMARCSCHRVLTQQVVSKRSPIDRREAYGCHQYTVSNDNRTAVDDGNRICLLLSQGISWRRRHWMRARCRCSGGFEQTRLTVVTWHNLTRILSFDAFVRRLFTLLPMKHPINCCVPQK